jgi:hypothetical protein
VIVEFAKRWEPYYRNWTPPPGFDVDNHGSVSPWELSWLFDQACKMDNIIEVGSHHGRSTYTLLSGCTGTVYAVDSWPGTEGHAEFVKNVGHFGNLKDVWEFSSKAYKDLPDADMVFLDANKGLEFITEDLKNWEPKAKCLICGHDYGYYWNDPSAILPVNNTKEAVDRYFGEGEISVFHTIWYRWKI